MSVHEAAHATIDRRVYSDAVVFKALYWLAGRYTVDVRELDTGTLGVTIKSTSEVMDDEWTAKIEARLTRDLIDFRTRQIVTDETRSIRDLLVAKAFADADITSYETQPANATTPAD
jgi:His-Xaa-Ser system protein HxsD